MGKCAQFLSPASCPDNIIFYELPLPKTKNQKLDRVMLRKIAIDIKSKGGGLGLAR